MYQFFVEDGQVREEKIVITGSDVNHIKNVLRMKPGEKIRVSDESGRAYFCHIAELSQEMVTAWIDAKDAQGTELSNRIYLFQGLPKSDKMELIIQKAVELGAYAVVPVAMKNCVVKLDEKKSKSRTERWQTIAKSAAKQSKRTLIPQVYAPISWAEALSMAQKLDIVLVPYENERGMAATREMIGDIQAGRSIGVMIGPEGGFAPEEIKEAEHRAGFFRISLGRRILRTETAGIAALSMLVYALDE